MKKFYLFNLKVSMKYLAGTSCLRSESFIIVFQILPTYIQDLELGGKIFLILKSDFDIVYEIRDFGIVNKKIRRGP